MLDHGGGQRGDVTTVAAPACEPAPCPDIDLMAEMATIASAITEKRRDLQERRKDIRKKVDEQRDSGAVKELRRSLRTRPPA